MLIVINSVDCLEIRQTTKDIIVEKKTSIMTEYQYARSIQEKLHFFLKYKQYNFGGIEI